MPTDPCLQHPASTDIRHRFSKSRQNFRPPSGLLPARPPRLTCSAGRVALKAPRALRRADNLFVVLERRLGLVVALVVVRDPDALLRNVPAVCAAAVGVRLVPPARLELQLVAAVLHRPLDVAPAEVVAGPEAGAEEASGRDRGAGVGWGWGGGCAEGDEEEGLELHCGWVRLVIEGVISWLVSGGRGDLGLEVQIKDGTMVRSGKTAGPGIYTTLSTRMFLQFALIAICRASCMIYCVDLESSLTC